MSPHDKGPGGAPTYTAARTSSLRIGIIHSRWNTPIITSLVSGAHSALTASGIPAAKIITQTVPGAYELPLAAQRMLAASQTITSSTLVSAASDLLGGAVQDVEDIGSAAQIRDAAAVGGSASSVGSTSAQEGKKSGGPFDAVIAIGVLIKGSTMHFEYISDAVSHGLMKVQLETGVPVIFGVLTCLTEEQARARAGLPEQENESGGEVSEIEKRGQELAEKAMGKDGKKESRHNHGEDWGKAAVEMAVKRRAWGEGRFVD